jgi:hypothetical protein
MVDIALTPTGILSYPHLFKARAVNEQSEPRFSCNLIFDKTAQNTPEFQQLRKLAMAAAVTKFGQAKLDDPKFIARLRRPFRPCADRPGVMGYDVPDGVFINPWSQLPPKVVGPDAQEITVPSDVFPGQKARVQVNAFAYDNAGNIGVSFGLQAVQITRRNMPRLDGRTILPFDRSTEEDDDVFGGTGDDMPF